MISELSVIEQGGKFKVFTDPKLGMVRLWIVDSNVRFNLHDTCLNLGYTKKNSAGSVYLRKDLVENICESIGISGVSPNDTNIISINKDLDFTNTYIEESSFYDLALESKAKNAREFRKWITNEVLPQIRQTGGYIPIKETDTDDSIMARALLIANKTLENKDKLIEQKEEEIKILKPKADKHDTFLQADNAETMLETCNSLDIGRNTLLKFLRIKKILMHNNLPYAKFRTGGFKSRQFSIKKKNGEVVNCCQTFVMPKGLDLISDLIKEEIGGLLYMEDRTGQIRLVR